MQMSRSGFTIVEILIVVVILGILAMLVVPKFSTAASDARENSLQTDTATLRRQIEVYKAQHSGRPPHLDENGASDTANMVARLTGKTTASGKLDANGSLGPYLTEWPSNGYVSGSAGSDVLFGATDAPPRTGATGWYYSTSSGTISPNSTTGATSLDPAGGAATPAPTAAPMLTRPPVTRVLL